MGIRTRALSGALAFAVVGACAQAPGESTSSLALAPGTACELPATSAVVLHELMITPATSDPLAGQWIELYNPGDVAVGVHGWRLQTSDGQSHELTLGPEEPDAWLHVPPGGVLVLARSADRAVNGGLAARYAYGDDLALLPTGVAAQDLRLVDPAGAVIDEVALDSASWPLAAGASMALVHPHHDNASVEAWRPAEPATPWRVDTPVAELLSHATCDAATAAEPCVLAGCGVDGVCAAEPDPACCATGDASCEPYVVAGYATLQEGACDDASTAPIWHTCDRDAGNASCDPAGGLIWGSDCPVFDMGPLDACRCIYGAGITVAQPTGGLGATGCPVIACGHPPEPGGDLATRCSGTAKLPIEEVVDGLRWDLPAWAAPAPGGPFYTWSLDPDHPELAIRRLDVSWRQLHPAPGVLDVGSAGAAQGMVFESIAAQLAAPGRFWVRLWASGADWAPEWVAQDCGVVPFGVDGAGTEHLPIWDPCVWGHLREAYQLLLLDGGLLDDPRFDFVYVPGGFTWTEFDFVLLEQAQASAGLTAEALASWLGVMADDLVALVGPERAGRLVWTGEDFPYGPFGDADDLLAHDLVAAGLGIRNGIPENFNDHLNHAPAYGATITPTGHVVLDEDWVDAPGRVVGMETDCFEDCGLGPQTPEMLAYGVRMAALKALQLRANRLFVTASSSQLDVFPQLWRWVEVSAGQPRAAAPDAWVALREAMDGYWEYETAHDWLTRPWVKNLGRWVRQRDVSPDGVSRRGATKIEGDLFASHADRVTWEGRRTDVVHGQRSLYFDVDDGWIAGAEAPLRVHVSAVDGPGSWHVDYVDEAGCLRLSEPVVGGGTGAVRTASVELVDAAWTNAVRGVADLRVTAIGDHDVEVHFLRVVRACPAGYTGLDCNTPPESDLAPGWDLVWSDELNGSALDPDAWEHQLGDGSDYGIPGWGNQELQWYQAENATVAGGVLAIEAREEAVGGKAYTSARIRTKASWSHGRVEARIRAVSGQGLWPAFWMLPEGGSWPADGEIDVMELVGHEPQVTHGTVHFGAPGQHQMIGAAHVAVESLDAAFHVYAVEWSPDAITWFFDETAFASVTPADLAPWEWPYDDGPFYLLLNLAVGGLWPGAPDETTPLPQALEVDWVRVYTSPIPACAAAAGEVFDLQTIDAPPAGSEGFPPASEADKVAARASILAALAGDATGALAWADSLGYSLCRSGAPGPDEVLVWAPQAAGTGQARWAVRPGPGARDVVVEAPHIQYDLYTLAESLVMFEQLPARALVASGTHRCANSAPAGCSGTSKVCTGSSAPYKESDVAHTEAALFHAAHEAIAESFPDSWVVSVHGFGQDGASLSDGTTADTTSAAPVAAFAAALKAAFPDEYITTCNDYPGATKHLRLCGTTNVQGRHVNESAAPCTAAAPAASGRFIHLEQSQVLRLQPEVVTEALGSVAP